MLKIGLTGSIGMGKTTTSALFRDEGIPVIDADHLVHELYRGQAVEPMKIAFPEAIRDGVVDRGLLSKILQSNPAKFKNLESIVHPMVWNAEKKELKRHEENGQDIVILDIPLLYENGAEQRTDKVIVVTCAAEIQRNRVLSRPDMTEEKFAMILSRQIPDDEKRKRADFIIDTGHGIDDARRQVVQILEILRSEKPHA